MRDPEAGLTLIETLIVLSIVAIMAGLTVLSLGAIDRRADAGGEATRLVARLGLASDLAIVSGAPLALSWDDRGYRFLAWDPGRAAWAASGSSLLGARHDLADALRLERTDARGQAPLVISPDLPSRPAEMLMRGGGSAWTITFDGISASTAPAPG